MVWPDKSKHGQHFHCRTCRRAGDLLNLLQEVRGWSFLEAKKELGLLDDDDAQQVTYSSEARKRQAQIEKRQQEQVTLLRHLYPRMQAALSTYERPKTYLTSRGVSLEQAQHYGLGYIPTSEETGKEIANELRAWQGRLIFPLTSPGSDEFTFAGRTLALWRPGMTPAEHKAAIDVYNAQFERGDKHRIIRVLKTSPCGHFGYREATANGRTELVIPEGEFDALSLRIAGIEGVIAMGTGFSPSLIPLAVESVVLAMDADAPGKRAAYQLSLSLADVGLKTRQVLPSRGKDWNDLLIVESLEAIRSLFLLKPPLQAEPTTIPAMSALAEIDDVAGILVCAEELGVTLQVINGEIEIQAAQHEVPSQLLQAIQDHKTELVKALTLPCTACLDSGVETPATCEYDGLYYCQAHLPAPLAPTREDVLSNRVVQAVVQLAPGGGCEVTLLPCSADAYIARRKQELAEERQRREVEERERERAMAARRRKVSAA
jgi:hypothetical protein